MSRRKRPQLRSIRKEVKRLIRENLAKEGATYGGGRGAGSRPATVFHGAKAPKWPRYKKGKNQ